MADAARQGRAVFVATLISGWDLVLAISLGCNAVALGATAWWAWRMHRAASAPQLVPRESPSSRAVWLDSELAHQLLLRLSELATDTTQSVGEHAARLQQAIEEISALCAADDRVAQASLLTIAASMRESNEKLQAEVAKNKSELQEYAKRIAVCMEEARSDALVGIANRRALDDELARRCAASQRGHTPLCLLIADVDHFKTFNDAHGHQAGDEVLRKIAGALKTTVRDMDFVARYGGEEFALVLPSAPLEDAKWAAERVRKAVAETKVTFAGKDLHVTISVGLAQFRAGDAVASLVEHADKAMYAAKAHGRNCVYYYEEGACRPVDLAATAPVQAAPVAHQPLAQVAPDAPARDRRMQARYNYASIQRIAPYIAGQVPRADEFREVKCRDLSSSGISFWLPAPPECSSLVVALGMDGCPKYLVAEVVRSTPYSHGDRTEYAVGCRFTGRIEPEAAPSPVFKSPLPAIREL